MGNIKGIVYWKRDQWGNLYPIIIFPGAGVLCMCYQCQKTVKLQYAIGQHYPHLPRGGTEIFIPREVIEKSGSKTPLVKKLLSSS